MSTVRRILFILCFGFVLLSAFAGRAAGAESETEDFVYIDNSSDQVAYGATVAELNRLAQAAQTHGEVESSGVQQPLFAVLCRTDGRELNLTALYPAFVVSGPGGCYTLYFISEAEADTAVAELSAMPGMRYAERDGLVTACEAEVRSFRSWGAEQMDLAPFADYAVEWGSGSALVAVVDSGIYLHPDLAERMPESGYDYVDGDEDATSDPFGHGTIVGGIIADCTPNMPVFLYPIRVLNASGGGTISNVSNGILEAVEKGVTAINLSLESRVSAALDDAVLEAVSSGITVVVAAGNHSKDTSEVSPAHLQDQGVIVVGAVDADGEKTYYTNYGESVDVYCYGSNIESCATGGGYTVGTGTSMAAPHITAMAVMLKQLHPEAGPGEIESRILIAADYTAANTLARPCLMIPVGYSCSVSSICLGLADTVRMPRLAKPREALEIISFTSSDETVVAIVDGELIPQCEGTATITVSCRGLDAFEVELFVVEDLGDILQIPEGVTELEEEAFCGDSSLLRVILPEGLESLGSGVFDDCENLISIELPDSLVSFGDNLFSNALLMCREGSSAEQYAMENGCSYIALGAE